jgi:hypothetical protein
VAAGSLGRTASPTRLSFGSSTQMLAARLGDTGRASVLATARVPATLVQVGLAAGLGAEVDEAIDELRDVAHGLHPQILAQAGVGPALRPSHCDQAGT